MYMCAITFITIIPCFPQLAAPNLNYLIIGHYFMHTIGNVSTAEINQNTAGNHHLLFNRANGCIVIASFKININ